MNYKRDKRAYVAYFNYLLEQEKNGATNVNGHTIQQEQDEVKTHIDNLDLMIIREDENIHAKE